jgi:hypothetical protein
MGVAMNLVEATTYSKLADDQGHVEGQHGHTLCVEKSSRLSANLSEVAKFIRLAADRSGAESQFGSKDGVRQLLGVSINFDEAARCFKLVADQGVSSSQVNFGGCLLNGLGISVNHAEAARYFKLAADQGDSFGQLHYGPCLTNGEGVLPDILTAVKYFKLAVKANHPSGHVLLGIGCCVDPAEAADLFKMAADQGNVYGQFNYVRFCFRNWHDQTEICMKLCVILKGQRIKGLFLGKATMAFSFSKAVVLNLIILKQRDIRRQLRINVIAMVKCIMEFVCLMGKGSIRTHQWRLNIFGGQQIREMQCAKVM